MFRRCYLTAALLILILSISASARYEGYYGNVSKQLQNSMIWIQPLDEMTQGFAFRKVFYVTHEKINFAKAHIFADSRYILWINGQYVDRGPCRFDPQRPEYDTLDVSKFLKRGKNTIAILVQTNVQNTMKMMQHHPGLSVKLEVSIDFCNHLWVTSTNSSWKYSTSNRFAKVNSWWSGIMDKIDASNEQDDWIKPEFDDSNWKHAVKIDGDMWGKFYPRTLPLLRETNLENAKIVYVKTQGNESKTEKPLADNLPIELTGPAEIIIDMGILKLAYWDIDFETDKGTSFNVLTCQKYADGKTSLEYINCSYKAKQGRQNYMSTDTYGYRYFKLILPKGKIKIHNIKFTSRQYPTKIIAKFQCEIPMLNKLWDKITETSITLSEDGYVDSAERSEWVGDGRVQYDITRTCSSTEGADGKNIYCDPRLIKNMIRHIAQSLQPDGRLKAHHPSNRWDLHWYIEDESCLWMELLRMYYNNTGDIDFVEEVWPAVTGQLRWYLNHKNNSGLITARDFLIHLDNPMRYQTCQGATLNAFIYGYIKDAAYLAEQSGKKQLAREYEKEAKDLKRAFNKYLWDEKAKTFRSAVYFPENVKKAKISDLKLVKIQAPAQRNTQWMNPGEMTEPTVPAMLMALHRNIVSDDNLEDARKYLIENYDKLQNPFTHLFLFKVMYEINTDQLDKAMVETIRKRWHKQAYNEVPGTIGEGFELNGYQCHAFGMSAGLALGDYILGVRKPQPIWKNTILIEPRLGDLKHVKGIGLTELGPVPVEWTKNENGSLDFAFEIPENIAAIVHLPKTGKNSQIIMNGKKIKAKSIGRFFELKLKAGKYKGKIRSNTK
ncbi:MAG: alpha-L-rhamnosidase N-terminal domain-containing protein [Planctomycetes bacterium]|nr:alpha-L-rhamnosidase N-terminal domain-containing protein [Planctomycetota bacterium]